MVTFGGIDVQRKPKLLGYYGDDFTGSTDAMEALTVRGIRTILFLEMPSLEMLQKFSSEIHAFGIAGVSRSLSPKEMDFELQTAFNILKESNVSICHYKTCSTFDSSPEIGSIGRAIDIASEIFQENQTFTPLVVGVPQLKRYTVFGNHFATYQEKTYRLDKHPIMSKHPVTPMREANLIEHLAKQTNKSISLIDILTMSKDMREINEVVEKKRKKSDIILFDVLDNDHIKKIGKVIWDESKKNRQLFTVGSSGIEYALSEIWKGIQNLQIQAPTFSKVGAAEPMLAVSGSCSVTTKNQIEYALNNGFSGIRVNEKNLMNTEGIEFEIINLLEQANSLLAKGKSVLIYSALGPDDPSIQKMKRNISSIGYKKTDTGKVLGRLLGRVTRKILNNHQLTRLLIAGGDTSGYVLKELNIYALQMIMPITPGAPLCKAYSKDIRLNNLELCLKGGQIGKSDFFLRVKNG